MKKIFKYLFYVIFIMFFCILSYLLTAYLFTLFPKKALSPISNEKRIHLLYNDLHSDIVFNVQDLNLSNFPRFSKKRTGYLSFGWGDKETYLNTPNINDIALSTSLKALFLNTPSLMHVEYIRDIHRYQNVKTIKLSKEQHLRLKNSILSSFNFKGKQYKGYGKKDFFYTAKGKYNLINTCNTWTGDQLRDINVSMNYWTPFSYSVTTALP